MKNLLSILIFVTAMFSSCRKVYECRCKEEYEGVQGYIEFSENIAMPKDKAENACMSNNRDFEGRKVNCDLLE